MSAAVAVRFAEFLAGLPSSGGAVFGGCRLSTDELVSTARRAGADLMARGLRPGERVAAVIDNNPAYLAIWFGAAFAGVEFVPINTRLRGDTLHYVLGHAAPRLVIADADHAAVVAPRCPPSAELVAADVWLAGLGHREAEPAVEGGGCIIYTSGTTGRPKGVRWRTETQARHGTVYAAELVPLEAGEHAYCCLPLFHVTATGVTLASLVHGAWVHLDRRFSASAFWQRIVETKAVFFPYVGTILSVILKDERPAPRHGVRLAMGAAASAEVFTRFEQRFGVRLLETYGQTELCSIWLANQQRVPGAVGLSCPRADFRLMPVEGIAGAGEIQVRPHDRLSMMSEYYGDPAATEAAWVDGWYRTRDLGTIDADGNYRYAGRLADYVRRRGENVSAYEVELGVLLHPHVVEAAVVGVDSDLGEQDIALYYVARARDAVSPAELHAWCCNNLSDFMVPRYYCAVDEVPKTETQRVQKGLLHARVRLHAAWDAERKVVLP